MQESESSHFGNVHSSVTIAEAFWGRVKAAPDCELYRVAVASSATATRLWKSATYAEVGEKVAKVARYLSKIGVKVGTPVAVISHTRPEWCIADMAIQSLGAVTVSIYQSLPAHEAGYILYDSGATVLFIENEEQAEKLAILKASPCPIPEREGIPAFETELCFDHVITFEAIDALSNTVLLDTILSDENLSTDPIPLPQGLTRDSIASLVYTSGTTGPPKGVPQRHGNHLSNVYQASSSGVFLLEGSLFLYLPLAHSFARLIYYIGFLTAASLVFPAVIDHRTSKVDLASVARDLREAGAAVVPSVPRLFEKMAAVLKTRAQARGLQSRILRVCIENALRVYDMHARKIKPSILQQIIYDGMAPVRLKIKRQLFGSEFVHGVSGGAKLDPEVNKFFDAMGMPVLEGYGLTETCVATHVNLPKKRRIGTVGPAFEGVEVLIDSNDGEILLKGPNVTSGYHNRPQATTEAWTGDGWFRTGDIGEVDDEGFLRITDRKKELIVTAGGKKIAPQSIEVLFKRCPFISQAFLFGEGKPYCVMLFTLNEAEVRTAHTLSTEASIYDSPIIFSLLQKEVDRVNGQLPSFETIKRFAILSEDFTIENGLLTPTLKVKRKKVAERHSVTIETLYRTA